jgi:hypothetical protein
LSKKLINWLVNKKKIRNTTGRELQVLKAVCIDAEKRNSGNTFSKQSYIVRETTKTVIFKLYHELKQIKMQYGTDIEQRKD